jgi:hypothetical protein
MDSPKRWKPSTNYTAPQATGRIDDDNLTTNVENFRNVLNICIIHHMPEKKTVLMFTVLIASNFSTKCHSDDDQSLDEGN